MIADHIIERISRRPPEQVIGGHERPYLLRWYVIPQNRVFNVYLHLFLRSDDDRALHDHPWANVSILLRGRYVEHTIAAGGVHRRQEFNAGDWKLRLRGTAAHRLELVGETCWTLFLTGPKYRSWGFHCPEKGWIPWQRFCAPHDKGEIGKGCEG